MGRDRNEALNSYVTDMLALEEHIEKAIRGQLTDLKDHAEVVGELRTIHRTIEHHLADLRGLRDRRGAGGVVEKVKRAGSAVAGAAAGLIDLVRTEGLAKNLRDDYTAFSLATVGYVMLYTSALSLDDREIADLARQHFRDYARDTVRLHALVPGAVVRGFREEGLPVRAEVLVEVHRTVEEVWGGADAAESNRVAIGSPRE